MPLPSRHSPFCYNFGAGNPERVRAAFRLALLTAISLRCSGIAIYSPVRRSNHLVVYRQFPIRHTTWPLKDFPLFASRFRVLGINIVSIGYFQSVERDRPAMAITLLRGFILILFCFWLMPILWGSTGNLAGRPRFRTADLSFVITIYCRRKRS